MTDKQFDLEMQKFHESRRQWEKDHDQRDNFQKWQRYFWLAGTILAGVAILSKAGII